MSIPAHTPVELRPGDRVVMPRAEVAGNGLVVEVASYGFVRVRWPSLQLEVLLNSARLVKVPLW